MLLSGIIPCKVLPLHLYQHWGLGLLNVEAAKKKKISQPFDSICVKPLLFKVFFKRLLWYEQVKVRVLKEK